MVDDQDDDRSGIGAKVEVRRVYDLEAGPAQVLVDRLWPRGVAKATLAHADWCKDVAPSTELRRWYDHDLDRFEGFRERYIAELSEAPAVDEVSQLIRRAERAAPDPLVLITATRDVEHSGAEVLRRHLGGLITADLTEGGASDDR